MADGGYGPIMQADGAVQVIAEQVMGTLFWLVFCVSFSDLHSDKLHNIVPLSISKMFVFNDD